MKVQTCKINTLFLSLQMLCEVENALYNLQIDLPPPKNITIITSKFWSKEGDVTQMLIQDSGVLKNYKTFLFNWKLIMLNVLNATKFDTCKTRLLNESRTKNLKKRCILERKHKKSLKKRIKTIRKQFDRNSSLTEYRGVK